jgi:hypothetical protein
MRPGQTGKTTTLATLARTLTAEGRYLAVRFSCEAGEVAGDDYAAAEEPVRYAIRRAAVAFQLPDQLHPPDPWPDAPARAAQGAWPARVRTRTASPHDMGLPSGGVPPRGRTAVPAGTWRRRAPAPPRGLHTQSSGGDVVDPPRLVHDCADLEDNHILDLAVEVGAMLVVSDDSDLTSMSPWRGTPILRPREFAARVDGMRRHQRHRR